ncbi:MAG TPA: hypothetical protein VKX17_25315 [Planctomycetota bacterium]|nr:hypothetical protein [Planctomycetota bacterium]
MAAFKLAALLLLLLLLKGVGGAEPQAITLAGEWKGTWTDSRKDYSSSGGEFSGSVIEKKEGVWSGTFYVGKQKMFKVDLAGRRENGKIVFDTAVNLGSFYGVYNFKGCVTEDSFSGGYDGPDERGTFKMTRAEKVVEKK